jgi:sterol desaturase/sphingolipid hydroxylase (fatty acid hydroxylase superfamily)
MEQKVLIYAVPVFSLFLSLEVIYFLKKKLPYFTWKDSIACLSMGLGNLGVGAIAATLNLSILSFFYSYHLFEIPRTWIFYCLFILLEDLCYYWFHRTSHVCRLWWAAHETHHSSRYYNFTTALRQTWTGPFYTWMFWAPLPLLGFPVEWVVLQTAVSLIYQFFLHTELVRTLGPLEWVMNTPSHHRVHHGINPLYLDRNYAGIFIIWDRLFGSFEPEKENAEYGVTHPLQTYNPFKIAFHTWVELWKDLKSTPKWSDRLKYLVMPPGWQPNGMGLTAQMIREQVQPRTPSLKER